MKLKKITSVTAMLFAFFLITGTGFAQMNKSSERINEYLKSRVEFKNKLIISNTSQQVSGSDISINKCELKIIQKEEGMTSTSAHPFMLVSSDGKYIKESSIAGLLEMPLFIASLQKKYTIKSEEDARLFQYVLDDLAPVSRSDIEIKTFYKKDNIWFFVREKRFDDLKGFILVPDDKNKVSSIEYITISEKNINRIKMKGKN